MHIKELVPNPTLSCYEVILKAGEVISFRLKEHQQVMCDVHAGKGRIILVVGKEDEEDGIIDFDSKATSLINSKSIPLIIAWTDVVLHITSTNPCLKEEDILVLAQFSSAIPALS